jgi:hypothetical protein
MSVVAAVARAQCGLNVGDGIFVRMLGRSGPQALVVVTE